MAAPTGYYIAECPNKAENGTFSCPHQGCGGRGFGSAEESQNHHESWHSGPYQCAECGMKFAAAPALKRHVKSSLHRKEWICVEIECELRGTEFLTHAAYTDHVKVSKSHKVEPEPANTIKDTIFAEEDLNEPEIAGSGVSKTLTSEPLHALGQYTCHEEGCRKWGTDLKYKSEFERHLASPMHRYGTSIGKRIRCQIIPSNILEAELNAIRSLQCNAAACWAYQEKFSNIITYVNHLGTAEHRCGHTIDLGDIANLESQSELDVGEEFCCSQLGCPREGHRFMNEWNFKQHLNSGPHVQAGKETSRRETNNNVSTPKQASSCLLSPLTPNSPMSPSQERSSRRVLNPPKMRRQSREQTLGTPAERSRLAILESENNDLQERVQRLEDQVTRLSLALTK